MDKISKAAVISVVRDSRNIKKTKFVGNYLELYAPKKSVVEPPEHRKLNTKIKLIFYKTFLEFSHPYNKKHQEEKLKDKR